MPEHVVEVVAVAGRPTAVVEQTTTWEQFAGMWRELLDEVYGVVRNREGRADRQWQNVMLYKDDAPTVEVGVLLDEPFPPHGRVVPSRLPHGSAAMTIHRGDYATLERAHDAVRRFAGREGLELAGPRWEIYGHWHSNPGELETEVYYLLA
jgi:effector-binding domain-containing protein